MFSICALETFLARKCDKKNLRTKLFNYVWTLKTRDRAVPYRYRTLKTLKAWVKVYSLPIHTFLRYCEPLRSYYYNQTISSALYLAWCLIDCFDLLIILENNVQWQKKSNTLKKKIKKERFYFYTRVQWIMLALSVWFLTNRSKPRYTTSSVLCRLNNLPKYILQKCIILTEHTPNRKLKNIAGTFSV